MTTAASERRESCEECGEETPHAVRLELRDENPADEQGFSREPYRVTRCRRCGTETRVRMNGA